MNDDVVLTKSPKAVQCGWLGIIFKSNLSFSGFKKTDPDGSRQRSSSRFHPQYSGGAIKVEAVKANGVNAINNYPLVKDAIKRSLCTME